MAERQIPWYVGVPIASHAIAGNMAVLFQGDAAVDGDASPWKDVGLGSLYVQVESDGDVRTWQKTTAGNLDADWSQLGGISVLAEVVEYSDFTDGGAAVGIYTSSMDIPLGARVLYSMVNVITAFTGNTSCALDIGDGTDDDRYISSTALDIFTATGLLDGAAPQGTPYHSAAKTPVLTATAGSDWGAVTAGKLVYKIWYIPA